MFPRYGSNALPTPFCAWLALLALATTFSGAASADDAESNRIRDSWITAVCTDGSLTCDPDLEIFSASPAPLQWSPVGTTPDHDAGSRGSLSFNERGLDGTSYNYKPAEPMVKRLLRIRELRLLTLWQNEEMRLFIGVSRDGLAGLNLSTARKKSKTVRKSPRDKRPVVFDPYRDAGAAID